MPKAFAQSLQANLRKRTETGTVPTKLRIADVAVTYGSRQVLAPTTLDVYSGELLAIIGPSGCGKSSLLQAINRLTDLIPQAQVQGQVYLDGEPTRPGNVPVTQLRRRVGMIFQKPNPFPLSIRANLELPMKEHGIEKRRRGVILEQVLRDVGLWNEVADRLDHPARQLSGGQQQRLCIARALALSPDVLLLDEPCSSLDPLATEKIEQLLLRLRGRVTLMVVTHNLAQARRIADRVAVFWSVENCGQLIECGDCGQIFEQPSHPTTQAYVQGRTG